MGNLDRLLFILFGLLAIIGLVLCVLCFRKALRVAGEKDGDLKMFFWALGAMVGLILSGMSVAYFLLPILFH